MFVGNMNSIDIFILNVFTFALIVTLRIQKLKKKKRFTFLKIQSRQLPFKHLAAKCPIMFEPLNFGRYVLKGLHLSRSLYIDVTLLKLKLRLLALM